MGLAVGEPFGLVVRFGMNNTCCGLKTPFDKVHHLVDTALERCRDMFVHKGSPSLSCDDVIPNFLERSHVYLMFSQPSFSPEHYFDVPIDNFKLCDFNVHMGNEDNTLNALGGNLETFESLGNFSRYDAALDPYCIYLVEKHGKIMRNTFFAFSFDFSMASSLLKRALTFFSLNLCMLSHRQA